MKKKKHIMVILEKVAEVIGRYKQLIITIFCIGVLLGVVYQYLSRRNEINEAIWYLQHMNIPILALLVPVIFFMWRAAGRIWYQYLKEDGLSVGLLSSIQYEINFVDTVLPFLSITGAAYALARLKKLKVPEGRASGMIAFRYIVSISTKWAEIAIAMVILAIIGKAGDMPAIAIGIVCVLIVAITAGFMIGLVSYHRRYRIPRKLRRHRIVGRFATGVQTQMDNLFQTLDSILKQKDALRRSFAWGMVYSLLEVMPFWVVATAMGHPELFLPIIVASGVAILVGIVIPTPMGIGGLDGAMILFIVSMGSSVALVSAIVLTTRILVLVGSVVTGIPFWVKGMRSIEGKE